MEDITGARVVELSIRADGKVIWVNIDGKCALRVCQINQVVIDDRRVEQERKDRKQIAENYRNKLAGQIFPDAPKKIEEGDCPTCGDKVGEFRDNRSRKEYEISGMCQKCQDSVFGVKKR